MTTLNATAHNEQWIVRSHHWWPECLLSIILFCMWLS